MHREAARLIKKLKLERHPEGGYFKQTFKSDARVSVEGFDGPRNISTAIYYMLVGSEFSSFHRLRSDEVWHHYAGGPVTLCVIADVGKILKKKIGKGLEPQTVMKADTWFAAALDSENSYCLLGCTMSPGFDYRDWELGNRDELVKMYPQHKRSSRDTQNSRRFQTSADG